MSEQLSDMRKELPYFDTYWENTFSQKRNLEIREELMEKPDETLDKMIGELEYLYPNQITELPELMRKSLVDTLGRLISKNNFQLNDLHEQVTVLTQKNEEFESLKKHFERSEQ